MTTEQPSTTEEQQQAPPPRPAPPEKTSAASVPPWEIVVMASGVLALVASFLPFYKIPSDLADASWSAWSNSFSLFPIATLAALYVVAAAVPVALARFASMQLPDRVAGFGWTELRLAAGGLATLVALSYLLRSTSSGDFSIDKGAGVYLLTLAAVALVVGAVMERSQGRAAQAAPAPVTTRGEQPSRADIAILAGGAAILIGSFLAVLTDPAGGDDATAWEEFMFPVYTLPALLGAVMAVQVALERFTSVKLPSGIAGLSWNKVHLALGVQAAVMMVGFLIGNFGVSFEGESSPEPGHGIGYWLMFVAAAALVAGAVMRDRESSRPAAPPAQSDA